jgi:hypothetical protein
MQGAKMRSLILSTLLICSVSSVRAADDENPWKNAKVGDWVEYKTVGTGFESKTKMTITAKDDKEVAYDIVATFTANGIEMSAPVQKQKIDLTKPVDTAVAANENNKNTKIVVVGEGTEKLKIGDKEYDTKWKKLKSTTTFNNVDSVTENKMWYSKEVPLSGLVRMDTVVGTITSKLELTGYGRK